MSACSILLPSLAHHPIPHLHVSPLPPPFLLLSGSGCGFAAPAAGFKWLYIWFNTPPPPHRASILLPSSSQAGDVGLQRLQLALHHPPPPLPLHTCPPPCQAVDVGLQRLQLALHHEPKPQQEQMERAAAQHLKEAVQRNAQVGGEVWGWSVMCDVAHCLPVALHQ